MDLVKTAKITPDSLTIGANADPTRAQIRKNSCQAASANNALNTKELKILAKTK